MSVEQIRSSDGQIAVILRIDLTSGIFKIAVFSKDANPDFLNFKSEKEAKKYYQDLITLGETQGYEWIYD